MASEAPTKQSRSPFAIERAKVVTRRWQRVERDVEVDANLDEGEAPVLLAARHDPVRRRRRVPARGRRGGRGSGSS